MFSEKRVFSRMKLCIIRCFIGGGAGVVRGSGRIEDLDILVIVFLV